MSKEPCRNQDLKVAICNLYILYFSSKNTRILQDNVWNGAGWRAASSSATASLGLIHNEGGKSRDIGGRAV